MGTWDGEIPLSVLKKTTIGIEGGGSGGGGIRLLGGGIIIEF